MFELLKSKLGDQIIESQVSRGCAEIRINRSQLLNIFNLLKLDTEFAFNVLIDITAIDFMDREFLSRAEQERFDLVYHLLSLSHKHRLRVKVAVPEEMPEVQSLCSLWSSANFMERETWDMYGITFKGHPDLRRLLMYPEFKGHPLRKDYPVQAKQPRVTLRYPEVENTARQMQRSELVSIRKRPNPTEALAGEV